MPWHQSRIFLSRKLHWACICKRIAVKEGNENSDKIKALVDVLKSDEIKDFINEKYDGAVIPFEDSDDAETGDAEAADDADETAAAEADTADESETDAE